MSVWTQIGDYLQWMAASALNAVGDLVEGVRTAFSGDPHLRRQVAFSVAMIALSAKMARADGVVTQDEIRAFHQIFAVPPGEAAHVARLYDLAKQDIAGFDVYARRIARLFPEDTDRPMLEDILDGLFHIAKADGVVHEQEGNFLRSVAGIFGLSEQQFESVLARHVDLGKADPYVVLGVAKGSPFRTVRARYLQLVKDNHPDRLIGRGMPQEFILIATQRLAAINAAFASIEAGLRP